MKTKITRLKPIVEYLLENRHDVGAKATENILWNHYQRLLESAAAELGEKGLLDALHKQGFEGDHTSQARFLVEEATSRRLIRNSAEVLGDD